VIRVLIADDHPLIRSAVAELLAGTDDITVVAQCSDGAEVAQAAALTEPDVVLMDLQMPRMSGLEATRVLREVQPDVRVIVLTGSWSAAAAREARALGVAGFLLKGEGPDVLPDLIRTVARGGTAWGPGAPVPCPPPSQLS